MKPVTGRPRKRWAPTMAVAVNVGCVRIVREVASESRPTVEAFAPLKWTLAQPFWKPELWMLTDDTFCEPRTSDVVEDVGEWAAPLRMLRTVDSQQRLPVVAEVDWNGEKSFATSVPSSRLKNVKVKASQAPLVVI